jgi:preprotein translocase subunit SecE
MLDFIYDSLDTVKKLKFPTVKQFVQLTAAIFGLVIIA